MRLAFISDIHGNAVALEEVLEDIKKKNVDEVFVLGDLCFRGPEPHRALELVRGLDSQVIKGNADEWVIRGVQEGEASEAAQQIMNNECNWTLSNLSKEDFEYIKNLSTEIHLEFGRWKIHAFHATPDSLFNIVEPYESDDIVKEKLMINDVDIYIYAHIHKPYIRYINGKCVINTGSVGLPLDGMKHASYVLLDFKEKNYQSSIVRVEYDINKVVKQLSNSNYPHKELLMDILTN